MRPIVIVALLTLWCSGPLQASTTLSASVQNFLEGLSRGVSIGELVSQQLAADSPQADLILKSAIASAPSRLDEILLAAIEHGVSAEAVAKQCETVMSPEQLENWVTASLRSRLNPLPILRRCLGLIEEDRRVGIVTLAVNESPPGGVEALLQTAFEALESAGVEAFAVIKTGLLASDAFDVAGLELATDMAQLLEEAQMQDLMELVLFAEPVDPVQLTNTVGVTTPGPAPPPSPAPPPEPPLSDD